MAFDPDAYLAEKNAPQTTPSPKAGFDPDAYLAQKAVPVDQVLDPTKDAAQQLNEQQAVKTRSEIRRGRQDFVQQNVQPGVPMDLDQSLPAGIRARLSVEGNIDKQAELLSQQPGISAVRKAKDGSTLIATVQGDDGKPKDVLLNPKSFSAGDIAGNAGNIAKAVGTTAVAFGTGGASLPIQALALGGTAAAMNAQMEGASRLAAGQKIDPAELAKSSLAEGGINAALPLAGAAGVQVARGLSYPFRAGAGAIEKNAARAAARQGVPLTAGQATGSGILSRTENLPGVGSKAILARQQNAIGEATGRALGAPVGAAVPPESAIAARVKPILAAEAAGAQAGVDTQMSDAARAAQTQIRSELDSGIVPSNKTNSEVGSFIRDSVAGENGKAAQLSDEFSKRYPPFDAMAKKEGIAVTPTNVTALKNDIDAKATDALLEFAPGIKKIGNIERLLTGAPAPGEVSPILDAYGRTQAAAATPPPEITITQIRELKGAVYDALQSGIAPGEGGVPNRYLTRLYKALSDDYDAAIAKGSPELQKANEIITKDYADKIAPLQQSDVAKLFLKTDSAGRLGDDEIVTRLFGGKGNLDALRSYKQVLGADSPEYKLLVRQGVNDMMGQPGPSGLIDASSFLKRLDSMTPEMQAEVLGPTAKSVVGNARLMATARGAKIPAEELEDALLASPGKAPQLLQNAIDRQAEVTKTYQTGILKQLRDGTINPKTLNEDRFVSDFLPSASESDVKQVLTSVAAKSPETVDAFRQRTLKNILKDVSPTAKVGQATTGENTAIDAAKLTKNYLNETDLPKYQAILGQQGVQFLKDLASINEAIAKSALQAKGSPLTAINAAAHIAGDAVPGEHGLVRTAVRGVAAIPEFVLGQSMRSDMVREFLKTGVAPNITNAGVRATRGAVLAAPSAAKATSGVLAGKDDN